VPTNLSDPFGIGDAAKRTITDLAARLAALTVDDEHTRAEVDHVASCLRALGDPR
jgi:hypothetical protein